MLQQVRSASPWLPTLLPQKPRHCPVSATSPWSACRMHPKAMFSNTLITLRLTLPQAAQGLLQGSTGLSMG